MNGDEHPRSSHFSSNRKPGPPKTHGYSPSSNYNYNSTQSQHGNHIGNGNHGNTSFNAASKPHHRKPGGSSSGGSFKRENHGSSDKIIKQNDIIIKLLKEIRDRLPAPLETKSDVDDTELSDVVEDLQAETQFDNDENDIPDQEIDDESVPEVLQSITKKIPEDYDELDNKVNGNY